MAGVWLLMVTGRSEQTAEEGEAEGLSSLYIKQWIECGELSLKHRHEQVKSLWITNKRLRQQRAVSDW